MRINLRALAAALLLIVSISALPTRAEDADPVEAMLAGMSLDEKVGQMFFVTCPLNAKTALKAVRDFQPGGLVMYAVNFSGRKPEGFTKFVDGLQAESPIPMLIATDEEGGTTTRVSLYKAYRKKKFPSPRELKAQGGLNAVRADAREKAELLVSIGVNVNLAPIADVPVKKGDFIYARAYDTDPAEVARFIAAVALESGALGVGVVLKHFPGYGNNRDTHAGTVVDKRPVETFEARDFLPFMAGFEAGAGAVMVEHTIVHCFDKKTARVAVTSRQPGAARPGF